MIKRIRRPSPGRICHADLPGCRQRRAMEREVQTRRKETSWWPQIPPEMFAECRWASRRKPWEDRDQRDSEYRVGQEGTARGHPPLMLTAEPPRAPPSSKPESAGSKNSQLGIFSCNSSLSERTPGNLKGRPQRSGREGQWQHGMLQGRAREPGKKKLDDVHPALQR